VINKKRPCHHTFSYRLKNVGLFQPNFGSNMDKLWKNYVKNVIYKCNQMALFVHIWPKIGLKQPRV